MDLGMPNGTFENAIFSIIIPMSNRFLVITILLLGLAVAGRDFYAILGVSKYIKPVLKTHE